jgi:hypothetical protein
VAERAADAIDYPTALKRLHLTPEQFDLGSAYRRPGPIRYSITRSGQREAVYSWQALAGWRDELKAFTALMK